MVRYFLALNLFAVSGVGISSFFSGADSELPVEEGIVENEFKQTDSKPHHEL